jgi:hypothetical protein
MRGNIMMNRMEAAKEMGLTLERFKLFEKHTLKKVKDLLHRRGIHRKDLPDYDNDALLETMRLHEPVIDETDPYIVYDVVSATVLTKVLR